MLHDEFGDGWLIWFEQRRQLSDAELLADGAREAEELRRLIRARVSEEELDAKLRRRSVPRKRQRKGWAEATPEQRAKWRQASQRWRRKVDNVIRDLRARRAAELAAKGW